MSQVREYLGEISSPKRQPRVGRMGWTGRSSTFRERICRSLEQSRTISGTYEGMLKNVKNAGCAVPKTGHLQIRCAYDVNILGTGVSQSYNADNPSVLLILLLQTSFTGNCLQD